MTGKESDFANFISTWDISWKLIIQNTFKSLKLLLGLLTTFRFPLWIHMYKKTLSDNG